MDSDTGLFESTPTGSLTGLEEDRRLAYLEATVTLPTNLRNLLFSPKTGAYIRGLARGLGLTDVHVPRIAFAVLRVVIGEITLAQLGVVLSTDLQLPTNTAQAMAKDIEKELFGPVMVELNQYLQAKQKPSQPSTPESPNLLDLRDRGPVTGNQ